MSDRPARGDFRAGLVQMCSGRDVDANLEEATELIREAARGGADYVLTPEMTSLMASEGSSLYEQSGAETGNRELAHFRALAADLEIWLHIGSIAVRASGKKVANRSYLFNPGGELAARYDKIHMFDAALPDGETYTESKRYLPGQDAVLAEMPWGLLGMTICYDLRFARLYRSLAKAGASFLSVPSAFTQTTGKAHWHTLLRARAIETGCFVFAAAQGGHHENGRETFGHSLAVSPWGEIIAEGDVQPSVIFADVKCDMVDEARRAIPSLHHDRPFKLLRKKAPSRDDTNR